MYSLGGQELRAAQHQLALARPFGRQPQAVPKLQLGFEEVGLQPVHGFLVERVVQQRVGRGPGDASAGGERGLVLPAHFQVGDPGVDQRHVGAAVPGQAWGVTQLLIQADAVHVPG